VTIYVTDSSAILALIKNEVGAAEARRLLPGAILSSVNLTEVLTVLSDDGMPSQQAEATLDAFGFEIEPFDRASAREAARLRPLTRHRGLSLGDRACLALAQRLERAVLTADRHWADLGLPIDIRLIR
jgi:PIN domain nuclease of toxin-antitoxin system